MSNHNRHQASGDGSRRISRHPIHRGLGLVFLMGWIVWVIGCQSGAAKPLPLMMSDKSYFSDVPMPQGFHIIEQASEDCLTGKRRVYVRHVYEGKGDGFRVRAFYEEYMPQYQWQYVTGGNVEGVQSLKFIKGSESCNITITRPSGFGSSVVRVQVMIMPEDGGSPGFEAPKK